MGKAQTLNESEMALFSECRQWCARIVLDTTDIVREGIFRQLNKGRLSPPIGGLKKESVAAFPDLRKPSDFPLLEHLAAFSEFCQTLLVVDLPTLHAAN